MAYAVQKGFARAADTLASLLLQDSREKKEREREEELLARQSEALEEQNIRGSIADIFKDRSKRGVLGIEETRSVPQLPSPRPLLSTALEGKTYLPEAGPSAFPREYDERPDITETTQRKPGFSDIEETIREIYKGQPISRKFTPTDQEIPEGFEQSGISATGQPTYKKIKEEEFTPVYFSDPESRKVYDINGKEILDAIPKNAKVISTGSGDQGISELVATLKQQQKTKAERAIAERIARTEIYKKEKGKGTRYNIPGTEIPIPGTRRDLSQEELAGLRKELASYQVPEEDIAKYLSAAQKAAVGDVEGYNRELANIGKELETPIDQSGPIDAKVAEARKLGIPDQEIADELIRKGIDPAQHGL